MQKNISGATLRKMFVGGVALLDQNKKLVDALNVFPVPDGDTGTNMFLTLKSAVTEVNNCIGNEISDLCEAFSKGALRGARGNSGVISSQIVKGLCTTLASSKEITNTKDFEKIIMLLLRLGFDLDFTTSRITYSKIIDEILKTSYSTIKIDNKIPFASYFAKKQYSKLRLGFLD